MNSLLLRSVPVLLVLPPLAPAIEAGTVPFGRLHHTIKKNARWIQSRLVNELG